MGNRIFLGEMSPVRQKSRTTKVAIATFHGQTTVFQSCPKGPRHKSMKACIPRARITAQFLYLVSNPTPMLASTKGATMPMERTGSPRDSGSRATRGPTS